MDPSTGEVWQEGDVYLRENFADTLERIATVGGEEFYTGYTAINMIADLADIGGQMTMDDLESY